jgi:hypothetical protein
MTSERENLFDPKRKCRLPKHLKRPHVNCLESIST